MVVNNYAEGMFPMILNDVPNNFGSDGLFQIILNNWIMIQVVEYVTDEF